MLPISINTLVISLPDFLLRFQVPFSLPLIPVLNSDLLRGAIGKSRFKRFLLFACIADACHILRAGIAIQLTTSAKIPAVAIQICFLYQAK